MDTDDTKAILAAAENGDAAQIERILARNPQAAKARGPRNRTPLMIAAIEKRVGAARALLPFSDANAIAPDGRTALMHAAMNGDAECVAALLPATDPDWSDRNGEIALSMAAHGGHAECVRLLAPRSNPRKASNFRSTAITLAARSIECMRALEESSPAPIDWREAHPTGLGALAQAAGAGCLEAMERLLPLHAQGGAEADRRVAEAMMHAVDEKQAEALSWLIERAAPQATQIESRSAGGEETSLAAAAARLGWTEGVAQTLPLMPQTLWAGCGKHSDSAMEAAIEADAPQTAAWMAQWGFDHGVEGHQKNLDAMFARQVAKSARLSMSTRIDRLSPWVSVQTLKETLAGLAKIGEQAFWVDMSQAKARVEAAELREAVARQGAPAQGDARSGAPGEKKAAQRL